MQQPHRLDQRRVVHTCGMYAEARRAMEALVHRGLPDSAVGFRPQDLRFVRPPERPFLLLLTVLAAAGVVAGVVGALVLDDLRVLAGGLGAAALLAASWWLARGRRRYGSAGYVVAQRFEVVVDRPYADDAVRILADPPTRPPEPPARVSRRRGAGLRLR